MWRFYKDLTKHIYVFRKCVGRWTDWQLYVRLYTSSTSILLEGMKIDNCLVDQQICLNIPKRCISFSSFPSDRTFRFHQCNIFCQYQGLTTITSKVTYFYRQCHIIQCRGTFYYSHTHVKYTIDPLWNCWACGKKKIHKRYSRGRNLIV